jgi:hypothetical protein
MPRSATRSMVEKTGGGDSTTQRRFYYSFMSVTTLLIPLVITLIAIWEGAWQAGLAAFLLICILYPVALSETLSLRDEVPADKELWERIKQQNREASEKHHSK